MCASFQYHPFFNVAVSFTYIYLEWFIFIWSVF